MELIGNILVALLAGEDEEGIQEEDKMIFYAEANVGVLIPPHSLANTQLTVFHSRTNHSPSLFTQFSWITSSSSILLPSH